MRRVKRERPIPHPRLGPKIFFYSGSPLNTAEYSGLTAGGRAIKGDQPFPRGLEPSTRQDPRLY